MARITQLHKKWMKEPKYRKAYEALEAEFVLASAVIDVRNRAGLTQEGLGAEDGHHSARRRSSGKRPFQAVDANAGKACGCHRLALTYQLRAADRQAASLGEFAKAHARVSSGATSLFPALAKESLHELFGLASARFG